ncbi:MAG: DUF1850 domain-containing protein [Burkholderiales bacterium]
MTVRPGTALLAALVPGLAAAAGGDGACLALAAQPEGRVIAQLGVPAADPAFTVTYVHSVTRTPVVERYVVDGGTIVQTEIRFAQHGPGLPTQPDAGGTFERRDGQFVMTMARRFPVVVMRVHADQQPRLAAGGTTTDLAAWGNRALALRAAPGPCPAP